MRRFWLEPQAWVADELVISGDLSHHLRDVCRFSPGDRFELLQSGEAWFVETLRVDKRQVVVRRLERRAIQKLPLPHLHLALSVPRFAKVDWIVEKSVELGVHTVHPFVSDYSFVRDPQGVPRAKLERWKKIVQQASQQAGRGELMELSEVSTLKSLLDSLNLKSRILCLFPYEGECGTTLKQQLSAIKSRNYEEIWVFVGSEGGFSSQEVEQFRARGIEPVSLGAQVLRVETACLALASILKYEFEVVEHGSF